MIEELKKSRVLKKPKRGSKDLVHTATKIGLSMIPVVGGVAKELFNNIITPPLAKRRDKWIESIVEKLRELEEQFGDFNIDDLSKNESFISTVTYATMIAIRNHQEEKLEALSNAVMNSIISQSIEEDLQHMFLNFIDELTPWHLRILKYFENPKVWLQNNKIQLPNFISGSQRHIFNLAFPNLKIQKDFADQLIRDLYSKGLSQDLTSMNVGVSGGVMVSSHITSLGRQFLGYITTPIEKGLNFKK